MTKHVPPEEPRPRLTSPPPEGWERAEILSWEEVIYQNGTKGVKVQYRIDGRDCWRREVISS
jgi:hypothetical protein